MLTRVEIATRPIQSVGPILQNLSSEPSLFTHWAVRIQVPADGGGIQVGDDDRYWIYYELVKTKIKGENRLDVSLQRLGRKVERLADGSGIPIGSISDEADVRFAGALGRTPDNLVDCIDNRPDKAFQPLYQKSPIYGIIRDGRDLDDISETGELYISTATR